jgi:hypothetical protein
MAVAFAASIQLYARKRRLARERDERAALEASSKIVEAVRVNV